MLHSERLSSFTRKAMSYWIFFTKPCFRTKVTKPNQLFFRTALLSLYPA